MQFWFHFWLFSGAFFLILEVYVLNFFFFCIAFACLLTSVSTSLGYDVLRQWIIFPVSLIVIFSLTYGIIRPLYKFLSSSGEGFNKHKIKDSAQKPQNELLDLSKKKLVGTKASVVEKIENYKNKGLIKVEKKNYKAVSKRGIDIAKGVKVQIKQIVIRQEDAFFLVDI